MNGSLRILAVDPGTTESAYVVLKGGLPTFAAKVGNAEALRAVRLMAQLHQAEILAVEMVASYGMPVGREVFQTCLWAGRFVEAWDLYGRPFRLVYRSEVKSHLCHSARANDANIRAALLDKFGPGRAAAVGTKKAPGPLYGIKNDMWAALAVAVTCAETPAQKEGNP